MSGKPAARQTDPASCPLPGHGTNPIVAGSPNVLFDGLPAARQSDVSACGSPIASAVASTVFINGLPAATLGSVGAHGNVIIGGSGTVLIGDASAVAAFTPPVPLNNTASPLLRVFPIDRPRNGQTRSWPQGQGLVEWRMEHPGDHGCRWHDLLGQARRF